MISLNKCYFIHTILNRTLNYKRKRYMIPCYWKGYISIRLRYVCNSKMTFLISSHTKSFSSLNLISFFTSILDSNPCLLPSKEIPVREGVQRLTYKTHVLTKKGEQNKLMVLHPPFHMKHPIMQWLCIQYT